MHPTGRRDISFSSADGIHRVKGYFYEAVDPFCVLQISHGMCEYIGRYAGFARHLTQNGVVVCGNDHLGHGQTAGRPEHFGHFSAEGGRRYVLEDLNTMNELAHRAYPTLPLVLLGHSMGSFFARKYAAEWPNSLSGLIISGTGGANPLAGTGIALAKAIAKVRGDRYRSKLLETLVFGSYLNRVENPKSGYDWVSRDEEVVRLYAVDPGCNFHFTLNGFHELFCILQEVSGPAWAASLPKELPVLIFSGDEDPVGGYGEGVKQVHGWLREAGVQNLFCKLYPGGRHEMLNELNREEVYADVLDVLRRWWGPKPA